MSDNPTEGAPLIASPHAPPPASVPSDPSAQAARRAWAWLLPLVAVALLAWLAWFTWRSAGTQLQAAQDEREQLAARIEALGRTAEQARRDAEGMRSRLDDATKVNASLRDQLLGFGERARLLEDAVANLADKRLSGHDALLLNEAEMLLALGAERYSLFHDANGTIEAYRLADTALAAVEDAAFSSVRQGVQGEVEALTALAQADTAELLASLASLRAAAAQLPPPQRSLDAAPGQSRWARLLGQFVRVRHDADATALAQRHDVALARQLFVLDLRDAEVALLARDAARWRAALEDARAILTADFDPGAEAVRSAQTRVAALAGAAIAPQAPANLGAALRELRNLRATHALRQPSPKADADPS